MCIRDRHSTDDPHCLPDLAYWLWYFSGGQQCEPKALLPVALSLAAAVIVAPTTTVAAAEDTAAE